MVNIEEHIKKMEDIKKQAESSKGNKRLQLMKCYHILLKQLNECKIYLNRNEVEQCRKKCL